MYKFLTPVGTIAIDMLGHASLLIKWENKNIFIDPYSEVADFSKQPKADLVLLTHHHYDHLDKKALQHIVTGKTIFVTSSGCSAEIKDTNVLRQGESYKYGPVIITAVFAYNIIQKNDDGNPFHPRGEGNGYILNFGGYNLYIAGDTELIPEMEQLGEIDLAFLPKNLPYTMSDEMFIKAAITVKPKKLFAYHYFQIDTASLKSALPKEIELQNK